MLVGFSKIFSERTQRLIDISKTQFVRRSSDVSISGKNNSNEISSVSSTVNKKEHRRRQQFRKRRQECRKSVEIVEIVGSTEEELKSSVNVLYNDLIGNKPPVDAFHSFLASLKQYFVGQTWGDGVENLLKQFLSQNVLLEASKLAEKYLKFAPDAPLSRKLDEYKFQVFLHLYALPANEAVPCWENLETVVNLLRMINFMADHKILIDFLEEDIFEMYFDVLPRHLTHLYEELGQPIPPELLSYADNERNDESFFEPVILPSPLKASNFVENNKQLNEDSNHSCSSQQSVKNRKRASNFFDNKHHTMITVPKSGAKKLKLGGKKIIKVENLDEEQQESEINEVKIVKSSRRSLKFTQTSASLRAHSNTNGSRTPKGKGKDNTIPETPAFRQVSQSENRRRKLNKLVKQHGSQQVVNETPPRLWAKVPVRQSPRQHASTRALYSCVPSLLSRIQKCDGGQLLEDVIEDDDELLDSPEDDLSYDDIPELFPMVDNNDLVMKSTCAKRNNKKKNSLSGTTVVKKSRQSSSNCKVSKGPSAGSSSTTTSADQCTPRKESQKKNNSRSTVCSPAADASHSSSNSSSVPSLKLKLKRTESIESSTSSQNSNNSSRKLRNGVQKTMLVSEYKLPTFATNNYYRYMVNIKKERNKPPKPGDDPFYARGTRRNSVFYENPNVTACYADEQKAPKSRSGRKMKTSVEFFHLAHYLLNVKNENPSDPLMLKNLQRTVNTPIKLNKKLRLAPKNGRKRAAKLYGKLCANANDVQVNNDVLHLDDVCCLKNDETEAEKLKLARLSSADTDCSEEIISGVNLPTHTVRRGESTKVKQELVDVDDDECTTVKSASVSYNLRLRSRTASDCGEKILSQSTATATSKTVAAFNSITTNGFLRRNIFEWAEISSRTLIDDDVFLPKTNNSPWLL